MCSSDLVAVRSGDWVSMAVSSGGMGEEMDECVCSVSLISLHKAKQTVNSDRYASVNRGRKQMKLSQYYPLVVGIGLTRFGLSPDFFLLFVCGASVSGASARFREASSVSCLAGTQGGGFHEIGIASMGSKRQQSSSSSSEMW